MAVSATQIRQFFEHTAQGFVQAADDRGETAHNLTIAGRAVRVRFAGDSLTHLARPLAHLASAAAGPIAQSQALNILAWDSPDGWLPPRPPWDFRNLGVLGEIPGLEAGELSANYSSDHGLVCLYHRPTQRALFWLPDAKQLPFWERAAPFRILLHWWSQSFGGQVCHAAAVGRDGRGVLLVGRGGSGKSTTAIACVDAGMDYVGDDYVLLTRDDVPLAHSLYNSAKIHTPFLRQVLSHWTSWVAEEIGPEYKSLVFMDRCLPRQVRDRLLIEGVVQPQVTNSRNARISRRPASHALLAIAPSTMYQLPEARQQTLSFLANWTRSVPAYLLRLGTDLSSAPNVLSRLLAQEGAYHAA
jgi:hypothetical protein